MESVDCVTQFGGVAGGTMPGFRSKPSVRFEPGTGGRGCGGGIDLPILDKEVSGSTSTGLFFRFGFDDGSSSMG